MSSKKKPVASTKPAAAPQITRDWRSNTRGHLIFLFVLGLGLYLNTLGHQFASDDAIVITDNEYTEQGLAGIPDLFRYDTFRGFFKVEGKDKLVAGGRYRPLTPAMFAVLVQFVGQQPFAFHLLNVLSYALSGILIYLLVLRLMRGRSGGPFVALVTGALFVTHPLHTEVVANIKSFDEIATLFGSLLALLLSVKAHDEGKPLGHWLAAFVFFLALLAKENAITFLAVVPLAYYVFRGLTPGAALKRVVPFGMAALAFLALRFSVLGWSMGSSSRELMNNPFLKLENGIWVDFNTSEKLGTILFTLGKYSQLLVFPHPLTHDYYPRHIDIHHLGQGAVLLSLALYLALAVWSLHAAWRRQPLGFAGLYFLATLSIVSNLVFPIGTNMGERFLYMPSLGFCLALGLLAWPLARKGSRASLVYGVLALVLLAFSVKTVLRNPVWKDDYTLFTTDVKVSQRSAKLQVSAGGKILERSSPLSDEAARSTGLERARQHLLEALKIHPTYKQAYLLLGNVYVYQGAYEQAIAAYQEAIRIDPASLEANNNLGIALRASGQYEQAVAQFNKTLSLRADYPIARQEMGVAYREWGKYTGERLGNPAGAIPYLLKALEWIPDDFATVRLLGVAHGFTQQHEQALRYFSRAVELASGNEERASALFDLGSAWYHAGDEAKAQQFHQQAVELDPNLLQKRNQ
jgi:tetratricopeptide (TPR) repeat protein